MASPRLWDIKSFGARRKDGVAGDTLHGMFWNGVAQRGGSLLMRQ